VRVGVATVAARVVATAAVATGVVKVAGTVAVEPRPRHP
jgi:hypothetical protein